MIKCMIPDVYKNSIDDLSPAQFTERGIKAVALDIDNTLVTPHTEIPDERAERFIEKLLGCGIQVILISNNKKERIDRFNTLSLYAIYRAGKPFTYSYKRVIKELGIQKHELAAVGDQIYADIIGANLAGAFTVLVKPIKIGGEGWFVWLKRKLEAPVIKKLEETVD